MSASEATTDAAEQKEEGKNATTSSNTASATEPEQDDSLSAMKKRVAAIQAEAAQISAMSTVDPEDENAAASSSLTPPKSQSQEAHQNGNSPAAPNATMTNNQESQPRVSRTESDEADEKNVDEKIDAPRDENGERYPQTPEEQKEIDRRSVFIKGIDDTTDANDLKAHFESCGTIERVTICMDKYTGNAKGTAYIQFKSQESVAAACLLHEQEFQGKVLEVHEKRTNLPTWMRNPRGGRGRGVRGRGGRGRGQWRGGGYGGRGGWGYGPYRGRGGYGGWAPPPYAPYGYYPY